MENTSLPPPILYDPSLHQHLLYQFAQIHIESMVNNEIVPTFSPPFEESSDGDPDARVVRYWLLRSREVEEDTRFVVMQLSPDEEVLGVHLTVKDGSPAEIVYRKLGYTKHELDRGDSVSPGRFAVYSKVLKDQHTVLEHKTPDKK
ncbi:hypothetical protein MBLNU457_7499t1 [Dothideomycetes sp. NU457]